MKALGKALAFVMLLALVGAGTATAAKMITGADVANGTLTGADIMNGTVKKKDLSDGAKASLQGAAGPAGAIGPAGPAGPEGPAGPAGKDGVRTATPSSTPPASCRTTSRASTRPRSATRTRARYCFTFPTGDRPTSGAANGLDQRHVRHAADRGDRRRSPAAPPAANVQVRTYDLSVGRPTRTTRSA